MFVGHFGVGFGAKAAARQVSLGTLFLAAQFVDLLWPFLLQLGIERVELAAGSDATIPLVFVSYPISHSLLMALVWGAMFGGVHWAMRRRPRAALIVAACVVSHWLLDLLVHAPDLPLHLGDAPKVGLGLWEHPALALVAEMFVFAGGLVLYLRATAATDRTGVLALWGLVAFLLLIQVASTFGPPPTEVSAIAWIGHLQWLIVLWGWWVDRHRVAVG